MCKTLGNSKSQLSEKNKEGTAWFRPVQDSIRQLRAKSNASKQIHALKSNVYVYIRICVMHMDEKIKKHDSYSIGMLFTWL